jgi:large repetitive protein
MSSQQNPVITNAASANSGYYVLQLSNAACTSPADSVYVTVLNPVVTGITGSDTVCEGQNIFFQVLNFDSTATYLWNGPNNFSMPGPLMFISAANLSDTGYYTVTATLGACTGIADTIYLHVLPAPPAVNASATTPLCAGDTLFLTADSIPGATYIWAGSTFGYTSTDQNPVIPNVDSTFNDYFMVYAVNGYGCPGMPSGVAVTVHELPYTSLGADTMICERNPIVLQPTGTFVSYVWQDNTTNTTMIAGTTGFYSVMVTDSNGCSYTDSIYVTVIECDPQAGNVFTPNGDGQNDKFGFFGFNQEVRCEIYNRWGELVYEWNDPEGWWDGTNMRSNRPVSDGVYYYVAHVVSYDAKPSTVTGFIQLMR